MYNPIVALVQPISAKGRFLREMIWMLTRPLVVLYFLLGLTMPRWIGAGCYWILRTYLLTPNGLIAWAVVIALAAAFLAGVTAMIVCIKKTSQLKRAARELKGAALDKGYARSEDAARALRRQAVSFMFGLMMLPILFLVPCAVAIIIASPGMPALVREHGRFRYATKTEEIRLVLRQAEHRGVFTWLDSGSK